MKFFLYFNVNVETNEWYAIYAYKTILIVFRPKIMLIIGTGMALNLTIRRDFRFNNAV